MTDCNQDLLIDFLEGLADDTVAEHVASCDSCRDALSSYRALIEGLTLHHQAQESKISFAPLTQQELPAQLKSLVSERRRTWRKEQLRLVLRVQGVTDPEQVQRILDAPPMDLLKAAFPDDMFDENE